MHPQHNDRAAHVEQRHERHECFRHAGQPFEAAEKHRAEQNRCHRADDPARYAERAGKSLRD